MEQEFPTWKRCCLGNSEVPFYNETKSLIFSGADWQSVRKFFNKADYLVGSVFNIFNYVSLFPRMADLKAGKCCL